MTLSSGVSGSLGTTTVDGGIGVIDVSLSENTHAITMTGEAGSGFGNSVASAGKAVLSAAEAIVPGRRGRLGVKA